MPITPQSGKPKPGRNQGSMQALVKAEKLTQLAFVLPVSALVGWVLGGLIDRFTHQHWFFLVGLVLGVIAGFIQLFRMVSSPGFLSATAPDPETDTSGTGELGFDENHSRKAPERDR